MLLFAEYDTTTFGHMNDISYFVSVFVTIFVHVAPGMFLLWLVFFLQGCKRHS